MKKILLGLGSITAIAAPIAAVVSCGDKTQYVTTPAVDADGTTHNYLSDAQALVMKDLLHRVYPTVKADDIKAVELLKDGYSLNAGATSADSDYAIRFVFNKTVAIELGDYNKIMRENGELIFAAYNADGRVTSIVKNPNAPFTQHDVTGAPRDMVVAALNANDMEFTAPAPVVAAPVHVEEVKHFDFTADLAKLNVVIGANREVTSTKHAAFFAVPLSTSAANLTLEFLGLQTVQFSEGVTFTAQLTSNVHGHFSVTATLTKGEDKTTTNFTIIAAPEPVPVKQVAHVDLGEIAKLFDGKTFTSTLTYDELCVYLDNDANPTISHLGVNVPSVGDAEVSIASLEFNDDNKVVEVYLSLMHGDDYFDTDGPMIIHGSDHVAAPAHVAYDFTTDFHNIPHLITSSKTTQQIQDDARAGLIDQNNPTLESLGIVIHVSSEGVTATVAFPTDENNRPIMGPDNSIGMDVTLTKGSDHATERHFLVPHVQEQVMTSPDPDVAGMVPMAPPIG